MCPVVGFILFLVIVWLSIPLPLVVWKESSPKPSVMYQMGLLINSLPSFCYAVYSTGKYFFLLI